MRYKGFTIKRIGTMGIKPLAGIYYEGEEIHETWGDGDTWKDSLDAAKDFIDNYLEIEKLTDEEKAKLEEFIIEHQRISEEMDEIKGKYPDWFNWGVKDKFEYETLQKEIWKLNQDIKLFGVSSIVAAYDYFGYESI